MMFFIYETQDTSSYVIGHLMQLPIDQVQDDRRQIPRLVAIWTVRVSEVLLGVNWVWTEVSSEVTDSDQPLTIQTQFPVSIPISPSTPISCHRICDATRRAQENNFILRIIQFYAWDRLGATICELPGIHGIIKDEAKIQNLEFRKPRIL